jgi:tRNA A37 threonylcarbamoyladenosine biosynthesis protein TsaE
LDSHLCLIEWPKGLDQLADLSQAKMISIHFEGEGRRVTLKNVSQTE